jgi:hypothetical protein
VGEPSQNDTIYVIPLLANHCKSGFDWAGDAGMILRWCPFCSLDSIIGHGWRVDVRAVALTAWSATVVMTQKLSGKLCVTATL